MIELRRNMFGNIQCPKCETRHIVTGHHISCWPTEECNCEKCGATLTILAGLTERTSTLQGDRLASTGHELQNGNDRA